MNATRSWRKVTCPNCTARVSATCRWCPWCRHALRRLVSAELVPAERFDVAWPGEAARAARNLTEIWLMSFRSQHTRVAYRRDLTGWLAFCDRLGVQPADAKMAHVDLWIEAQRTEAARRPASPAGCPRLSSWYRYLIDNTGGTRSPSDVQPGEDQGQAEDRP